MTDNTSTDIQIVGAFEDMLKNDMVSHLRSYHGVQYGSRRSLDGHTKDELVKIHKRYTDANSIMDDETVTDEGFRARTGMRRDWYVARNFAGVTKPHEHSEPITAPTPDGVAEAAKAIRSGKVPTTRLNASERKALTDLVNNDFAALAAEMRSFAADVKQSRREAARAEAAEKSKGSDRYLDKIAKAVEKADAILWAAIKTAEDAGYTVKNKPIVNNRQATLEVTTLAGVLADIDKEVEADLKRAMAQHRQAHLSAQRTILLTGVPSAMAQELLDSIPDAKTLMAQQSMGTMSQIEPAVPVVPWRDLTEDAKREHLKTIHGFNVDWVEQATVRDMDYTHRQHGDENTAKCEIDLSDD